MIIILNPEAGAEVRSQESLIISTSSPQAYLNNPDRKTEMPISVKKFVHMSLGQGVQAQFASVTTVENPGTPGNHFLMKGRQTPGNETDSIKITNGKEHHHCHS